MVGAVCRGDHVPVMQRGRRADGDGLLADARVDRPVHELLVFEQPLLGPAYDLELEQEAGAGLAGVSPRSLGLSTRRMFWGNSSRESGRTITSLIGTTASLQSCR